MPWQAPRRETASRGSTMATPAAYHGTPHGKLHCEPWQAVAEFASPRKPWLHVTTRGKSWQVVASRGKWRNLAQLAEEDPKSNGWPTDPVSFFVRFE